MEKITDDDLKAMLTKQDTTPETIEEDSDDIQLSDISKEEVKEAFNNIIDATFEVNEDTLQDSLEEDIDFNTIPENIENTYEERPLSPILEKRKEITLGFTPEEIQALFNYILGKGEKPLFVDKFMSDTEGRLKEMSTIMTMIQLARIPTLTAYNEQVMERLFDPSNLYDMDSKTLSATMTNLNKDIMNIIETSIKTVQTNSQFGSLSNEYRNVLDGMMMLPPEKFKMVRDVILENEKKLEENSLN